MTERDTSHLGIDGQAPSADPPTVAVIGGGIAGLAAAWEASMRGAAVTVFDAAAGWGGKLRTTQVDGTLVDQSADAFLARVPHAVALCEELGIADQLVAPARGNALLWWDGEHVAFPTGTALGVPIDPAQVENCPFLSEEAADRVRDEMARTGPGIDGDVSVGEYMRTHFGDEITDLLVEPMLGGINAAEIDMIGMDTVAPQLGIAARDSASIVNAIRAQQAANPPDTSAPVFYTHPEGMGAVVSTLVAALSARGVTLRDETAVTSMAVDDAGKYRLGLTGAAGSETDHRRPTETPKFDAVVVAIPADRGAALFDDCAPTVAAHCRSLRYASVAVVTLTYRAEDVPELVPAAGLLVPRSGPFHTTAVSFASEKWAHQAQPDRVLLRASLGHYADPEPVQWDDERLVATTTAELAQLLGVTGDPTEVRISRWVDGFPQYEPGHQVRLSATEQQLAAAAPGVALAGASFHGIGVPTCIRSGRDAAAAALSAIADTAAR